MATKKATTPKGRYYDPPATIRTVEGVTIRPYSEWSDRYVGTAEALVATRLISHDQLPGHPGLPARSVAYRPRLAGPWREQGHTCFVPGYMEVVRKLDGVFQIVLTVSDEEQARRRAQRPARDKAQYATVEESVAPRTSTGNSRKDELDMLVNLHVMPKSHAAYRKGATDALRSVAESFVSGRMQAHDSHGYRYSAEAIDDFTAGFEELVDLLSEGATLYDERRQFAAVNSIVGESAKKDMALQRLLGSSIGGQDVR